MTPLTEKELDHISRMPSEDRMIRDMLIADIHVSRWLLRHPDAGEVALRDYLDKCDGEGATGWVAP